MAALLFVFLFGPMLISKLKIKQGKGQPIRDDGPVRHIIEKQGTPTMGGLMILSGIVFSTLLWGDLTNLYIWSVLFVILITHQLSAQNEGELVILHNQIARFGQAEIEFDFPGKDILVQISSNISVILGTTKAMRKEVIPMATVKIMAG